MLVPVPRGAGEPQQQRAEQQRERDPKANRNAVPPNRRRNHGESDDHVNAVQGPVHPARCDTSEEETRMKAKREHQELHDAAHEECHDEPLSTKHSHLTGPAVSAARPSSWIRQSGTAVGATNDMFGGSEVPPPRRRGARDGHGSSERGRDGELANATVMSDWDSKNY